jgi:hypothetical protein
LNSRPSKASKWELKKQLDDANNALKILKNTTNLLIRGKNRLVMGAHETEVTMKNCFVKALNQARRLDEDRRNYKEIMKKIELKSSNTMCLNKDS